MAKILALQKLSGPVASEEAVGVSTSSICCSCDEAEVSTCSIAC